MSIKAHKTWLKEPSELHKLFKEVYCHDPVHHFMKHIRSLPIEKQEEYIEAAKKFCEQFDDKENV